MLQNLNISKFHKHKIGLQMVGEYCWYSCKASPYVPMDFLNTKIPNMNGPLLLDCIKLHLLCSKEGNPREAEIMGIYEHILYEHIRLAAML